ncbi:methyltransferase domain-containing protein [Gordonia sp. NPDC003950]
MTVLQRNRSALVQSVLGEANYRRVIRILAERRQRPRVGKVRFGDLRRTQPICREYGFERGRPVDRYYIESFLERSADLITGAVLEVGERTYTERFGRGVTRSDMLNIVEEPGATYVDDLTDAPSVPSNTYDCIILTQTLQMIFDLPSAIRTIYRILKPGGVLLCTAPGISQIADPVWNSTWYWSFTELSANRLFGLAFPPGNVDVRTRGNVLSATTFLYGMAEGELRRSELDVVDPEYPVIITIAARKGDLGQRQPTVLAPAVEAATEAALADDDPALQAATEFLSADVGPVGAGPGEAAPVIENWAEVDVADIADRVGGSGRVLLPRVLEHNWGWRRIMANAVASSGDRLAIVLSVPLGDSEMRVDNDKAIPALQLPREEFLAHFAGMTVREDVVESGDGTETVIYVEK